MRQALLILLALGLAGDAAPKVSCPEQLHALQVAVDAYRSSHQGRCPRTLRGLKLEPFPTCPVTGRIYAYRSEGDSAWIWCSGHPGEPARYPRAGIWGMGLGEVFTAPDSSRTACYSNLQNLGTAMARYKAESIRYPADLKLLMPRLPTCPEGFGAPYAWESAFNPDLYTIVCTSRHPGHQQGYPRITSYAGLETKPR